MANQPAQDCTISCFFQCQVQRDVGIIDVYRHYEGAPLNGAHPVIVQFKARREKEQIMWRAKEKLRNTDIVVTEDSQQRLLELMKKEVEKMKKEGLKSPKKVPDSPKKVPDSPKKVLDSPKKVPISPRKSRTRGNSPVKTPSSPLRKMPSLLDMLELPGKIVNKQLIQI